MCKSIGLFVLLHYDCRYLWQCKETIFQQITTHSNEFFCEDWMFVSLPIKSWEPQKSMCLTLLRFSTGCFQINEYWWFFCFLFQHEWWCWCLVRKSHLVHSRFKLHGGIPGWWTGGTSRCSLRTFLLHSWGFELWPGPGSGRQSSGSNTSSS